MERTRSPFAASRPALLVAVPLAALLASSGPLPAQLATVRVEENFRAEPNGTVLARLLPGTSLPVHGRRGRWLEVTVGGWVWMRSLQVTDRGGFDLVVSAGEGENLRARPRGTILARVETGTLLEEEERITGWVRVRRRGWVWSPSVEVEAPDPDPPGDDAPGAPTDEGDSVPALLTVPRDGAPVLAAPGGDTLARAEEGVDVEVVERRGGWVRVRLEGWLWAPPGSGEGGEAGGGGEAPEGSPGPGDVADAPDRWVGRVVTWDLQFVSLERAEMVRTDFFEGEPYLLTRIPGEESGFVYVAVPPDRLALAEGLTPLETVRVTGRIRAGASALTGNPILDLLGLRRVPR